MKISVYSPRIEAQMRDFYNSLSEKDRRRYAAIEASKLGSGGITYICSVLQCDEGTLRRGRQDFEMPLSASATRLRKPGGGRKSVLATTEGLDTAFLEVLRNYTAGSPMDETLKWTNLSRGEIATRLQEHGFTLSVTVVDQLLEKPHFRPRQAFKSEALKKNIPQRDEQFKKIEELKEKYHTQGNPVMSMDVKKTELIGNFYRPGKLYTTAPVRVNDHDFESVAEGKVVPHGLYDIYRNLGYLTLGTSHDTSEFSCTCLRNWWFSHGQLDYPNATSILLLCDGGGSNNARYYIFKEDLQALSDELKMEIRIAHYPLYTSKYNPIEHRLFPHVTKACEGIIFKSIALVNEVISKTTTSTGLKVFTSILEKTFETGRKVAHDFKENMKIQFDEWLPQWNYVAVPSKRELSGVIKS
jgi:Rhodopirellula transposase DDE domain